MVMFGLYHQFGARRCSRQRAFPFLRVCHFTIIKLTAIYRRALLPMGIAHRNVRKFAPIIGDNVQS